MSKNKALQEWLDSEAGYRRAMRHTHRHVNAAECAACAAWHAAVKHTLEFIVNMLRRDADWIDTRVPARDLADVVARLKP